MKPFLLRSTESLKRALDLLGDVVLYLVLFLVAWKFLWGVVALGLWKHVGTKILELVISWPLALRMPVGLLMFLIVFSPVILLGYWLFGDPQGLGKIVALRKNTNVANILELVKKGIYCGAVISILRHMWSEYNEAGNSFDAWRQMLGNVLRAFVG